MDGVLLHCFSLFIRNRDELRIGFRLLTFRGCCYLRRCCSFRGRMDDIIGACIGISVVTDTDDLYRGLFRCLRRRCCCLRCCLRSFCRLSRCSGIFHTDDRRLLLRLLDPGLGLLLRLHPPHVADEPGALLHKLALRLLKGDTKAVSHGAPPTPAS